MKFKFAAIFVILVITLVSGFSFAFIAFSKKEEDKAIVLVKESGIVYYKASETDEYQALSDLEISLKSGAFVKTDADSYARVFLPDNSLISIDQKTEISVNYQASKVDINQFIGKTWNRVESVSKGGEYKVETPNSVAAVRGTIFGVGVDNDDLSRVFVEESKVDVSRIDTKENNKKVLEEIKLEQYDTATIIRDKTSFRIEKNKTKDDLKDSFWYKRNKILDEEYSKLKGSKKRGIDFRKELLNNILKREDAEDFRLGLKPASDLSKEDIKAKLEDISNITKISDGTCSSYSQGDFQLALDKISAYKDYIENYDRINSLLTNLKNNCSDGKFDLNEENLLRSEVTDINNAN